VRVLALALVIALGIWLTLLLVAPVAVASSDRLAVLAAGATYTTGSLVCHQQQQRSFLIGGRQMPVCARCTGLYASALVGGVVALGGVRRRRVGWRARWILAALAIPTFVSWSTDYAGLTHTWNVTRALLALPLGAAAGWIVITLVREPDLCPPTSDL
jgi:uncharacterized membrane protein